MAKSEIKARLDALHERVAAAASRAIRNPAEITIVAVAKTVPVPLIEEAIDLGIRHVGENRVQEASPKFDAIGRKVTWHMVGHLQTNKVRRALEIFDVIQSVDSTRVAETISERSASVGRVMDVLLEVNTSGEPSKYGFVPEEVEAGAREICVLKNIRIKGLMTVGPLVERPEDARNAFALLRNLRDRISALNLPGVATNTLSMGMSGDLEVAIEEGATMIRVGTAIFGERRQ